MKAFVINLDRRPDRLAHISGEFAKAGVSFERVPAVDGSDPAVMERAARIPPSHWGNRISARAYACLQSHREVWRRLVTTGDHHGLVLEDDVVIAPGLGELMRPGWVPQDADVIRLETFRARVHLSRAAWPGPGHRRLHLMRSSQAGTGGYVLSARAAADLLAETEVTGNPVDEVMFNEELAYFRRARIYQMSPAPMAQGNRLSHDRPAWAHSDIPSRSANAADSVQAAETPLQRLRRRLGNEVRAALGGSRYVVVPHA